MDPGQITITRGGTSLLLHRGTVYRVNEYEPYDLSVRADQEGPIAWGDGSWSGAEWQEAAAIPMRLGIHTETEAELMAAWWALRAALAPVRTGPEVELTWNVAGTEYLMYARPREAKLKKEGSTGIGWVTAQMACPDPAVYSATEYSTTVGLLNRIGGLVTPFTTPFEFYSVVADGEATITNAGTTPARLLLRIDGPVSAPRITLVDADGAQTLRLDTVLAAGEWLDIDTGSKSVVLNGSVSRLRDAWGDWPKLTGTALIRFEADTYNADARLTVRHRDTY